MDTLLLLTGFCLGVLLAVPLARWWSRRAALRVRGLERRAVAAERLAELGTMTGGLAHEIKNPLSTLGLNVQLIQEDLADLSKVLPPEPEPVPGRNLPQHRGDPPRERLARIRKRTDGLHRETSRLREILEDYLRFAGRVVLDRSEVDVHVLCEEMVDFFQPQADEAGVRLRTQLTAARPRVHADPTLLKQALLNLLINACQAMTEAREKTKAHGGADELILRTFAAPPGGETPEPARVPGAPPGAARRRRRGRRATPADDADWLALQVIDTGPGMDPEVVAKVFQPYFSTKRGGTGLGLPTTRRVVEEHGGYLAVHSEPGRGTVFTMMLPHGIATPPARDAEPVAAALG